MHKAGVSHNDLHGGNIYVDDDRKANFLDLGLAKVDRLSALMEHFFSEWKQLSVDHEDGWGNLNNIELKQQLEFNVSFLQPLKKIMLIGMLKRTLPCSKRCLKVAFVLDLTI